jgi:peptidoglycan hydrolase-like protein with peptidoglycan-binding domain
MDTPFTKYTSSETEALAAYETLDEFESSSPFTDEHHDHESYTGETLEAEMRDQFTNELTNPADEYDFSSELDVEEKHHPLTELEIVQEIEHQAKVAKAAKHERPAGRTNWAKSVLNRVLGVTLPDDNVPDAATKKALEDFQSKYNLKTTRVIDSVTERTLLEADALLRSKGSVSEPATKAIIEAAKTKIEDWTKKAVNNKPRHILNSYRDPRKVYAFVLHQMAFKRWNSKTKAYSNPESYLATGAHFCIMFDGRIVQLHPCSRMIWHGNCVSPGSVAVEFEGNFPNIKGGWWTDKKSKVHNKDKPTQAQFESGRFLTSYLKTVLGTTHILAHRQSSDSRENDPGPDIWYHVGQWAIGKLALTDGGPSFKCGTGKPILPEWRTWGSPAVEKEFEEMEDDECFECEQELEMEDEMEDHEMVYQEPESAWAMEDQPEPEYDRETGFNSSYETEESVRDWSEAVRKNQYYGERLGWNSYMDRINDMLLPYSGMSNVSLGEAALAEAVFQWQSKNGFTGNNVDGIIGPGTWSVMRKKLKISDSATGLPHLNDKEDIKFIDGVRFKKKKKGWAAYGGGPLKEKLYALRQTGRLSISPNEIEMFRLVSIPESGGLVNAINSWDNMYMSMGFIQLTIRYYELAQVIKQAPDGFRKHGIELDPGRKYFPDEKNSIAIKNAPNIEDLRSLEWAKRFFKAGLEDDVIVAQIQVGRRILQTIRSRFDKNNYLDRFNDQYPNLWAFIYEAHNSRPAPLNQALRHAIAKASAASTTDPIAFGKILIEQLKQTTAAYYSKQSYTSDAQKQKKIADELAKVGRIVEKTGITK